MPIAAPLILGLFFLPFLTMQGGQTPEIKNEVFIVRILSALSASGNVKGDRFTLQVLAPAEYKDSMMEGEVAKTRAAGRVQGDSEILFSFHLLALKNGPIVPIVADLRGVKNSKGVLNADEEGRIIGKSSTKKDVATTAVLSGLGAVIGGIAGGGSGAAQGAAIGAAVGLTIAFTTRGEDIQFAPGTEFQLLVNSRPAATPR